jgi:UDP-glucose 4-epimerase
MRILVTGGAGFIGSNIVDAYIEAGHEVAVLDNLSTGQHRNIHALARFYEIDVVDAAGVARVFKEFRPQVVNHHAAQIDVRKSTLDPVFDAQVNILGSLNLLKCCLDSQVEKFIFASSGGAVYGEPAYLPADEQHPIMPICEYGVSKHTVEHYLHTYQVNYGLNYTVLRYANVYGPRQNVYGEAGVIAVFTGRMLAGEPPTIYGSGDAVRDYVSVGDVARANVQALSQGEGAVINIGTGVGTSVHALYQVLAQAIDFPHPPQYAPARVGEIACTYLDSQFAQAALAWQPQIDLCTGLQSTVAWAQQEMLAAMV